MKHQHWRGFQADNGRGSARVLEFVSLFRSKAIELFAATHPGEPLRAWLL